MSTNEDARTAINDNPGYPPIDPVGVLRAMRNDIGDWAADEIESLRKDLLTAHLMVAKDASDAPGRISHAIRPFLAGAVERHGIAPHEYGS